MASARGCVRAACGCANGLPLYANGVRAYATATTHTGRCRTFGENDVDPRPRQIFVIAKFPKLQRRQFRHRGDGKQGQRHERERQKA